VDGTNNSRRFSTNDFVGRIIMRPGKINHFGELALCAIAVVLLGSCATPQKKEVTLIQNSTATGVFREVRSGESDEEGLVDLLIRASIKTPVAGFHLFESKAHLHGKPGYPFIFNIDGQAATWKIDGITGDGKDPDDKEGNGPEVGLGVRYVMEERIRLAPGTHKVFFCLPEENYITENVIRLEEGRVNVLEYRPLYQKPGRGIRYDFHHGIARYEVFLNGSPIGP
jgi:hypothetical protein